MESEGSIDDIKTRVNSNNSNGLNGESVTRTATGEPGHYIIPAIFEQLYLAPHNAVKGQLRQTYGNPSPVALAGFVLCSTPAAMGMLGWQGSGGFMVGAHVGAYFGFGGLLMLLGAIGEWILGNTFPATVFGTFSAFWLNFAITVVPDSGAYGIYSTTDNPADGMTSPQFYATYAFFFVGMTMLNTVYMIASLRTNVAFLGIFVLLVPACGCFSGSFFASSRGDADQAETLQHAGASLILAVSLLGWYIFFSQTLASVEFPFPFPMGDLSTIIPSIAQVFNKRKVNKSVV